MEARLVGAKIGAEASDRIAVVAQVLGDALAGPDP